LSEIQIDDLVSALARSGIIELSPVVDELQYGPEEIVWTIVGNDKHIENFRRAKEKARNGGIASAEKRKQAVQPAGSTTSFNQPVQVPAEVNAVQFSAVQNNKNTHAHAFDFDSLYQKYPRKVGKQKGLQKAKKEIRSPEEFAELERALDRFCAYHTRQKTEPQFIPHFSTFMNSWRDWLDEDAGTVRAAAPLTLKRMEDL
jgi:hypothetical protein